MAPTSTPALSWANSVRDALMVPGVVYISTDVFALQTADKLLRLDSVPDDDKKKIKSLIRNSTRDKKTGLRTVRGEYTFSARCQSSGIGRLYPRHHPTLGSLPKDVRSALAADLYFDLDVANSHPTILRHLARQYGWRCCSLDAYVARRAEVLRAVKDDYGLQDLTDAKTLVLKVMNSHAVPERVDGATGSFLHDLRAEVASIANNLMKHTDFAQFAKLAAQKKGPITCLSDVVSDCEYSLLMEVVDFMQRHQREVGSLIMDGCIVRKQPGEEELSKDLIRAAEQHVLAKTGVAIELAQKPMHSVYAEELKKQKESTGLPAEFRGLGLVPLYPDEKQQKPSQPDRPAANLLQYVVGEKVRRVLRYTGPGASWQHYHASRGLWMPVDGAFAASVLQTFYMEWYDTEGASRIPGLFWGDKTHARVLNLRSARDILGLMADHFFDPHLMDRLDSQLADGLIPFTNTCVRVEPEGIRLVPHSPDNYLTRTIEFELPLKQGLESLAEPPEGLDFSVVDEFYRVYWSDDNKRSTVLRTLGALLLPQMRSRQKYITICTDKADGNTGKSVFSTVLMDALSILAQPLQPAMVYDSAQLGSRNGHGANELNYRGAYVAVLDEMKATRTFDLEALKKLAGGGIKLCARVFCSPKVVTFPWLALPLLLCNQRCLPQLDSLNQVDMGRFRFVGFETRFTTPSGAGVPRGYDTSLVKVGKEGVVPEMHRHRGAHMWRLLQAAHEVYLIGGAISNDDWPRDWVALKAEATAAADPLATAVAEVVLSTVEKGIVRAKGERFTDEDGQQKVAGKAVVDSVSRQQLVDQVMHQHKAPVASAKASLDAHMAELGFTFCADRIVHGQRVKLAYLGCKLAQVQSPCLTSFDDDF